MKDNEDFAFEIDPDLGALDGFGLFGDEMPTPGEDGLPFEGQEDVLFPDATPRNQYEPLDPNKMPQIDAVKQDSPEYAARPAKERTAELFAYMRPHRVNLMTMLAAAAEPTSSAHMEEVAEAYRKRKFSVYSASNLCTMLEAAGAMERVLEDGRPYSTFTPTPDVVVIDGEEYYKPTPAPAVHWKTTSVGAAVLDDNDPIARMAAVFEREGDFLPIYKQVLNIAANGASMAEFSEKVDANPDIANPRRFFVQHFVESLERCEAIAWDSSKWTITETGQRILAEMLSDVEEAPVFEPYEKTRATDNNVVPTETQGINW